MIKLVRGKMSIVLRPAEMEKLVNYMPGIRDMVGLVEEHLRANDKYMDEDKELENIHIFHSDDEEDDKREKVKQKKKAQSKSSNRKRTRGEEEEYGASSRKRVIFAAKDQFEEGDEEEQTSQ